MRVPRLEKYWKVAERESSRLPVRWHPRVKVPTAAMSRCLRPRGVAYGTFRDCRLHSGCSTVFVDCECASCAVIGGIVAGPVNPILETVVRKTHRPN